MRDAFAERIAELTSDVAVRVANDSAEDAERFVTIFNNQYERKVTTDYYFWQFFDGRPDKALCLFAEKAGELVGTYGLRSIGLIHDDERFVGALTVDEIVIDEFRRTGLAYRLEKSLEDHARLLGCQYLYALPNAAGARIKLKDLGWSQNGASDQYSGVPGNEFAGSAGLDFTEISEFEANSIDPAREYALTHPNIVMAERSPDYLNWRYVRNPWHKYRLFGVSKSNRPFGHLITKLYTDPNTGTVSEDLVDLVWAQPDPLAIQDMIAFGLRLAGEDGAQRAFVWCPDELSVAAAQRLGLQPEPDSARPLCVKSLQDAPGIKSGTASANWYLTMGDSEIY